MPESRKTLETRLNDLNADVRRDALDALLAHVAAGDIALPEPRQAVNLHCHTTFAI